MVLTETPSFMGTLGWNHHLSVSDQPWDRKKEAKERGEEAKGCACLLRAKQSVCSEGSGAELQIPLPILAII